MRGIVVLMTICGAVGGCGDRAKPTIANNSTRPIVFVYAAGTGNIPQRLAIGPVEVRTISGNRALYELEDIVIVEGKRSYVFKHWPPGPSRSPCADRCTIDWRGGGRLGIGPGLTPRSFPARASTA